jgi:hypothetical protein
VQGPEFRPQHGFKKKKKSLAIKHQKDTVGLGMWVNGTVLA